MKLARSTSVSCSRLRWLRLWAVVAIALAAAQAARADGHGLSVTDTARLHAGLELELRWDTMAGIGTFSGAQKGELILNPGDLVLHLRPVIRLDAPGAETNFVGQAKLDYSRYSGLMADTTSLTYLGILGDLAAEFGRGGATSFAIADHFSRSDRTSNPALGVGSITDSNTAEARLNLKPGGGALEGGLGYAFTYETYETSKAGAVACSTPSCDGSKYPGFASQTHRLSLDARWRFLPKTAIVLDAAIAPRIYSDGAANVGTRPLRATLGIAGLLTEKVRIALKAGYANTFASAGQNFGSVVGQAEVGWTPRETATLTVGLSRSVESVSDVYGWYDDLRGYASGQLLLLGKLTAQASLNYDLLTFGAQGRVDNQFSGNLQLEYEVTPLWHVAVGEILSNRNSTQGFAFTYTRSETYARVSLAY